MDKGRLRNQTLLSIIVILGFLVRLAAVLTIPDGSGGFGDSQDYVDAAQFICNQCDYPEHGNLPFFRAPGLPFFLAATTSCQPEALISARVALAACDTLLIVIVAMTARLFSRRDRPALLAAAVVAVYPFFVFQVTGIRSEILFAPLLTLGLFLILKSMERASSRAVSAAGVSIALASLVRPSGLVAVPFIAAVLLICRHHELRQRVAAATTFALFFAVTLGPWITFNYFKYNELIIINDAFGYNLWRGTHPTLQEALNASSEVEYRLLAEEFEFETSQQTAAVIRLRADSPGARSREWISLAIERIRESPRQWFQSIIANALRFWRPWLNPAAHGTAAVAISGVTTIALYSLSACGLRVLWKRNRRGFWITVAWFLWACVAHAPFQVVMRFRIPFTDPLLIVLAALAVDAAVPNKFYGDEP
jgi:hypothetical protein